MDDGAAPRGDAGRVRERFGFPEVDGVTVSWNDDFCGQGSPRVAEHYIARGRHAALAAVVMLGLALSTCCTAVAALIGKACVALMIKY